MQRIMFSGGSIPSINEINLKNLHGINSCVHVQAVIRL